MRTIVFARCGKPFAQRINANSMNIASIKKRLKQRERQLLEEMERNQTEAREGTERDTPEAMERSVNLEGAEALLRHNDADFQELEDVRAALTRMDDGEFGKCLDCGKPIPEGRLEAIPWAQYCVEDQQRHDDALGEVHSLTM
jgi:DnaK suppressor protein